MPAPARPLRGGLRHQWRIGHLRGRRRGLPHGHHMDARLHGFGLRRVLGRRRHGRGRPGAEPVWPGLRMRAVLRGGGMVGCWPGSALPDLDHLHYPRLGRNGALPARGVDEPPLAGGGAGRLAREEGKDVIGVGHMVPAVWGMRANGPVTGRGAQARRRCHLLAWPSDRRTRSVRESSEGSILRGRWQEAPGRILPVSLGPAPGRGPLLGRATRIDERDGPGPARPGRARRARFARARPRDQAASVSMSARFTCVMENHTGSGLLATLRRIGFTAASRSSSDRNGVEDSSPSALRMQSA